jgi:hypothetical protein
MGIRRRRAGRRRRVPVAVVIGRPTTPAGAALDFTAGAVPGAVVRTPSPVDGRVLGIRRTVRRRERLTLPSTSCTPAPLATHPDRQISPKIMSRDESPSADATYYCGRRPPGAHPRPPRHSGRTPPPTPPRPRRAGAERPEHHRGRLPSRSLLGSTAAASAGMTSARVPRSLAWSSAARRGSIFDRGDFGGRFQEQLRGESGPGPDHQHVVAEVGHLLELGQQFSTQAAFLNKAIDADRPGPTRCHAGPRATVKIHRRSRRARVNDAIRGVFDWSQDQAA